MKKILISLMLCAGCSTMERTTIVNKKIVPAPPAALPEYRLMWDNA